MQRDDCMKTIYTIIKGYRIFLGEPTENRWTNRMSSNFMLGFGREASQVRR